LDHLSSVCNRMPAVLFLVGVIKTYSTESGL
jgi:hypothetical protein